MRLMSVQQSFSGFKVFLGFSSVRTSGAGCRASLLWPCRSAANGNLVISMHLSACTCVNASGLGVKTFNVPCSPDMPSKGTNISTAIIVGVEKVPSLAACKTRTHHPGTMSKEPTAFMESLGPTNFVPLKVKHS